MEHSIIGRDTEKAHLKQYINSKRSEFVAIYGRRRIGKTFLVKELFEGKFTFRMTGKERANTREQLANFTYALSQFTSSDDTPSDWAQAFQMLSRYIERLQTGEPKILFFDEMPWLDTRGSDFVSALEHFWNDWAAYRNDVKLIVCGSATTWMLDNVINSRGGLHNRVTHKIQLSPFNLHETQAYFQTQGFPYERQEVLECYMAVGGVAYYLSLFEPDKSVAQNIDNLCFSRGAELADEFNKVFKSLFHRAGNHIAIVTALQKKGMGMTRMEIMEATHSTNNGNLSTQLRELEECDFIRSYIPFGKTKKNMLYQLIDPFTLFHFHFMHEKGQVLKGYWLKMQTTAQYANWCGYAFEIVCLNHIEQIVHALGIDGTINTPCSWSYRPPKSVAADSDLQQGAQIDLLIDRSDRTINICEIKYSLSEYEITNSYDDRLNTRIRTFLKVTKTRKSLVPVFITPNGLFNNMYSRRVPRIITADDLFK